MSCSICKKQPAHQTGEVRGLLCNNRNRAIGLLGDDAELLRRAADYLDGVQS